MNVDPIHSTPDGVGCFTCITKLQTYLSNSSESGSLFSMDFVGRYSGTATSEPLISGIKEIQYAGGGLGQLLALACDVHELHCALAQAVAAPGTATVTLQGSVLRFQEESDYWLSSLPQNVVTMVFGDDLPLLIMLAFKFSLDLVLYRCTVLRQVTAHLPPPSATMAVVYLRHVCDAVSSQTSPRYSDAEHQLFLECISWPAWVLSWAIPFVSTEKFQSVIQQEGIDMCGMSPPQVSDLHKPA